MPAHGWTGAATYFTGTGGLLGIASLLFRRRDVKKERNAIVVDQAMKALELINERQAAELTRVYAEDDRKDRRIADLEAELAKRPARRGTK